MVTLANDLEQLIEQALDGASPTLLHTCPFFESCTRQFVALREQIITAFEAFEPNGKFERTVWQHKDHGGGQIGLLRGKCFEKAGVNFSAVAGDKFPGSDGSGPFFATGVSLVTHMANPKMPTVHMNVRTLATPNESWIGGGYDLTPMGFDDESDTAHFHSVAKHALDKIDPTLYPTWSDQAREYFTILHRKKERGVGGIFFDHYSAGSPEADKKILNVVGESFLDAILPIYKRHIDDTYTDEDKERQLIYRGHYAEFNLAYDRGTRFGFLSGANPEAILVSLPPLAKW